VTAGGVTPARPGQADDAGQVKQVLVRFARALDERDWEGYAALYAEDGTLDTSAGMHVGRAGLAEFVAADLGGFVATSHVSASADVEVDGDNALVRSSLQATHVRGPKTDFWTVGGWYDVTLRRSDGRWQITSTIINPVWVFDSRTCVDSAVQPSPVAAGPGLQPPS